ncbi:spermidine synthase [Nanoarchaeota archaeon]
MLVVFISGMSIMAIEMSASRLLAPYFGSSLFVWTNIIGIIMMALSIGYYVGGKLGDKFVDEFLLYEIIIGASFFIALIPLISKPIMALSLTAIDQSSIGLFYGSLVATIVLFSLPLILLGMVSPYAIRVCSSKLTKVGNTAGNIYSLSTVGSIIGTFIPALITIPFMGTARTIILFALFLMVFSSIGLLRKKGKSKLFLIFPLLAVFLFFFVNTIKPVNGLIFEDESIYNYIQVVEDNEGRINLHLNEGVSTHSIYDPDKIIINGVWDYFNIIPLLKNDSEEILIIGIAAGTIAREYDYFFPNINIDGVEIDSSILEVGRKYFGMKDNTNELNSNLVNYEIDGRVFLKTTEKYYDAIIIDAYKQPYIPFHLTTKEFFKEVKLHLKQKGVVAINVGSTDRNSEVLGFILNTMKSVFDNVWLVPVKNSLNFLVLGSESYYNLSTISENIGVIENYQQKSELADLFMMVHFVQFNHENIEFDPNILVLTDDKAPVEIFTDKMIFEYAKK